MSRHITDHDREESDAERVRAYVEIERAKKPSAATTTLQRKGRRGDDDGRRVEEFVRIERGHEA